jgi:hypothetical protein
MADRDAEAEFGSRGTRVPPHHRRERAKSAGSRTLDFTKFKILRSVLGSFDRRSGLSLSAGRFTSDECVPPRLGFK